MAGTNKVVRLRRGRERSLLRGHPWVFSGAVDHVEGDPAPGDTVDVLESSGQWIARAAYSPASRIVCRVWTFDDQEAVDGALIERRLEASLRRRRDLAEDPRVTAYREVHAESDLLPGVIVDRYGDLRVVQLLTPGAERFRETLLELLSSRGDGRGIFERSDGDARALEGLEPRRGVAWGEAPPALLRVEEYGLASWVDLAEGHKTGAYLDQRENRRRVASDLRADEVLDAFCYTGGFTISALRSGAKHVVAVDGSRRCLELAGQNVELNSFDPKACEFIEADAFHELRRLRDQGRSFDAVVLDPPRFAPTASQVQRAARGYKDINLLAIKLLRPGGRLITFSCSAGVGPELFEKIVAGAAHDAGAHVVVEAWLGQPSDHPVGLHFPEGRYLKGLICRKGETGWYPAATKAPGSQA